MTTPADSLRERVIAMAQARSSDPCQYAREGTLALAVAAMVAEECARECEDLSIVYDGQESEAASRSFADICRGARKGADRCAAAIRQRAEGLK